ncbi:polysaccharide pyruvyl transferase family protein [Paractinoplanes ferrugineus]|uniref:Polysaccharide pyruvyl transferase n=1 Tax=Paractinoplanes ferrugineus TaxID=113564 RepID=A0A919M701_9ACTN|nr:polysaccharide pyruvyl transferase family protein [Actinoplanes ferrugineus]GIE08896.1 polysaccharide pyruvyl transferase [Actinoplanes ferrugineus]
MKILLSHAYSRHNAGDAALLSVLIQDVRDVYPDADLTVLMMDEVRPGETFDEVPVRPFPTHRALHRFSSRAAKLGHCLVTLASTTLATRVPALAQRRLIGRELAEYLRLCRESDLVVCVGGGYLRGKPALSSTFELSLLLQPLMLYRWMKIPTVLYAQSVGPFANRAQRWMAGHVLRKIDLVIAREDISLGILAGLGATTNVRRSVDSGFAFDTATQVDIRRRVGAEPDRPLVGITVRQWLDPAGQERYERAIATAADTAVEEFGATVVFVPQVTSERQGDDDRIAGRRVAARMRRPAAVLADSFDHHTIKALYGGLDLLIGTRFHSVIFAMTASVPVLAIEYEHKTSGIMHDLGLDEWVYDIATVDGPTLVTGLRRLFAQRTQVITQLAERLPAYQAQAQQAKRQLTTVLRPT